MCSSLMPKASVADTDHVTFVNNKMTAKLKHNLVLLVRDLHSSSRAFLTHHPLYYWSSFHVDVDVVDGLVICTKKGKKTRENNYEKSFRLIVCVKVQLLYLLCNNISQILVSSRYQWQLSMEFF